MEHTYSPEFDMGGTTARISTSPTGKTYLHTLHTEGRSDGTTQGVWRYEWLPPGPGLDALKEQLRELTEAMEASPP